MKFLAVLHLSFGPGAFGWANVDITVVGDVPTLENIREVEAYAMRTNHASVAVLTAVIPLAGE